MELIFWRFVLSIVVAFHLAAGALLVHFTLASGRTAGSTSLSRVQERARRIIDTSPEAIVTARQVASGPVQEAP